MNDVKYDAEKLAQEAQSAINKFKLDMKEAMDECLGKLYCDVIPYIETDAWTNYRESLRLDLSHEYKYSEFKNKWSVDLRRAIFVENREELSALLNQDLLARIKTLEDRVKEYDQFRYSL